GGRWAATPEAAPRDRATSRTAEPSDDPGPRPVATHGGGSSLRRLWEVCRIDLAHAARRPLFWFLILVIGFMTLELSRGHARLGSGSTSVGGGKAFITSEFAIAQIWVLLTT